MTTTTIPQTLARVALDGAAHFGDRPAQRFKRDGSWQDLSYAELGTIVAEIASGLVALGIQPGDRVCVLADTRPEWAQSQLACAAAGAVVVPIYPSNSPEECEWVIGNSGAVAVFCEDAAQLLKLEQVQAGLPSLKHVVLIEPVPGRQSLDELRGIGRAGDRAEVQRRTGAIAPDDPVLIIYTSGTTGRPKGCLLTNRNLMSCCFASLEAGTAQPDDVDYLFLPLAHVFAQVVNITASSIGAVVAFCSHGAGSIMPDLAEVRPTGFPSVPRIFEKIYAKLAGTAEPGRLAAMVRDTLAIRQLERDGKPVPAELRASAAGADPLFAAARQAFGGRLRVAISGAAPIAPEILEFFHAAGVPVYEGYGLSESAATGTVNCEAACRIGTIGRPIPGCEVRVALDGELLMRGPHIFAGYWENPEATAEVLADGWLRTGDLGAIDEDGFVRITGRKKDIIITAGGKNLTPSEMENDLQQSPFISHAVMHGDRRPYPVALITLDAEYVVPWARARGLATDLPTLAGLDSMRELVQQTLDRVNARHAKVAQIKRFAILEHDFSHETGELTPTLKLKRQIINAMYAAVFDGLYAQPR
jgi:long-chain acyl-CoA synthetase